MSWEVLIMATVSPKRRLAQTVRCRVAFLNARAAESPLRVDEVNVKSNGRSDVTLLPARAKLEAEASS